VAYWSSASPISGLHSPRFGDIVTELRVQHRSGIHRAEGFFIVTGPSIPQGETIAGAHILDLAPTILSLLGETALPHLDGRVLTELVTDVQRIRNPNHQLSEPESSPMS